MTPFHMHFTICLLTLSKFNQIPCLTRYSSRNLSVPIKANLHFSLSRSRIISLNRAEAVVEITEWVEVPKKISTLESNTTNQNSSSEAGTTNGTTDTKENLNSGSDGNSSAIINETNAQETVTEKVLKKRTFRILLKVSYSSSVF
jgi:hypoxia up-regulated 1